MGAASLSMKSGEDRVGRGRCYAHGLSLLFGFQFCFAVLACCGVCVALADVAHVAHFAIR